MTDPLDIGLAAAEVFCEARVPEDLRDQMRIECSRRGKSITIAERSPPWKPEYGLEWSSVKVAQLRFDSETEAWSLFCPDRNGRWHPYDEIGPTPSVDPLLAEIARDPTGIFWG